MSFIYIHIHTLVHTPFQVSMLVVTLGYVMVAATLTLMVPYYTLNPAAAIPDAFAAHNATWAKWVVSVGALSGMTTTLFGSLFTLPRCIYAMAADGLLFSWLARISDKTKVGGCMHWLVGGVT